MSGFVFSESHNPGRKKHLSHVTVILVRAHTHITIIFIIETNTSKRGKAAVPLFFHLRKCVNPIYPALKWWSVLTLIEMLSYRALLSQTSSQISHNFKPQLLSILRRVCVRQLLTLTAADAAAGSWLERLKQLQIARHRHKA